MIPVQTFGRTAHASPRISFGSYALNKAIQSILFLLIFVCACSGNQAQGPSLTLEPDEMKSTPTDDTVLPNISTPESANSFLAGYEFPASIDLEKRYLFYLHGKIIEDQGIPAVSPDFGEYEYASILQKLASFGFTVISEQRAKNTEDGMKYAERVAGQVNKLLDAGVPPSNITVIGASKGGWIAIAASHFLANKEMNFVVMGACDSETTQAFIKQNFSLYGNVLAIRDAVDNLSGSCEELFNFSAGKIMRHAEIVLHIGTGHGILYKPLDEWMLPAVQWTQPALQPITIENASEVQLLRTMKIPDYHKGQISQCRVAFNPDGRLLVGACGKNKVPVWEAQTGSLVHALYDAPVQIVACAFSPDGSQIACGGFDKTVILWDAVTGKQIGRFEHTASIWDITFDPAGKSLVACSLGLLGGGRGGVRLWNAADGVLIWDYPGTRDYLSVSFNPSGKEIAYGSIGGSVGILDVESGELTLELTDSSHNIGDVAYSPSGLWLAAGSDDNRIYLWDTSNYAPAAQMSGHAGYVNGVAFSPDETLLVSGSHDRTVGVWNLTDQTQIIQLKGHEREVLQVTFSPDGTMIASISWDGSVRLWGVLK